MVSRTTLRRKFLSILIVMSLLLTLALPSVALGEEGQWTSIGLSGADVTSLALSPNSASDKTLFAGTMDGVFKSTDVGESWMQINSGLSPNTHVWSLALSPNYERDKTLFAGIEGGICKSTDGGVSWTRKGPRNYKISSLAVSPNYVTDGTIFAGAQGGGVFKSTDRGEGWISIALINSLVMSVAISPNYATDGTIFAVDDSKGVFKSTNGGASWTVVNSGLPVPNSSTVSLALSPNYTTDETLFVGTSDGVVFKSTDGGTSWTEENSVFAGGWVVSLAISPNYANDHTLFAGIAAAMNGVYKSTDGGASWTKINNGLTNASIRSLTLSPNYAADGTIFAGIWRGGAYRYAYTFDATSPTTTLTTNPATPDGTNGWFVSPPTVTLTSSEPSTAYYQWDTDAGPWSTYEGPIEAPEGTHTLYYYSVDAAGNREATQSKAVNVDLTAPTLTAPEGITLEATGPDGAIVNFEATATDSLANPVITYSKNPGSTFPLGDTSVTVTATDEAGNSATKSFNVRVQDTTPPVITVPPDITVEATGADGAKVDFSTTATDAVGPVQITYSQNPGTVFSPGETTVTVTATDGAGNSATKSLKVTVTFGWSGFLQPISIDPNKVSVVKAGSTLPVKFKLTGASVGITDGTFCLYITDLDASGGAEEMAAVSTSQATTGNLFRYDATSGQYIFNLSTKGFVSGHTYRLRVDLGDRTVNTVQFLVK